MSRRFSLRCAAVPSRVIHTRSARSCERLCVAIRARRRCKCSCPCPPAIVWEREVCSDLPAPQRQTCASSSSARWSLAAAPKGAPTTHPPLHASLPPALSHTSRAPQLSLLSGTLLNARVAFRPSSERRYPNDKRAFMEVPPPPPHQDHIVF